DLRLAFADDAPLEALELEESCAGTSPAISGEFQPMQALTGFIGEPAQGTWELIVIDNFYDDGGYILDWSLEICVTYPNQAQVFLPEGNLPACVNAPSSASLYVGTGFEDNVSLLLQNLPSGASITLDSYIAAPGTYVQLSLDSFSQVGSADFQLIATDGNNYHDCTVGVLVNDRPTRPNLQLPVDQSPVFDDPIPFRWSFGVRTDSFLLEVATDSLFEDIVFRAATSQNEFTLSEHLPQGRYYWQVQAMNECGVKTSAVSSFIRQGSVTSTSALHLGWLRLFPNPADERVHIEFEGIGAASAEGQVFNSQGQLVKQIRFQRHTQIDISSWPSGLYILRLVVGNEQFVRRIIVE
ncbi:MAG TPA: T9SS type A sorting domain-containing protein, partial [Phaeodactylibacter sp.]|nr:T9SS type A sorting domain-containing protein [Phaeodactylibacter sp.]